MSVSLPAAHASWPTQDDNGDGPQLPPGFSLTTYAEGLERPSAMAWAPDGRLFVSERGGTVRVIENGEVLDEPFLEVSVLTNNERGLLGIAVDPDFETNGYIYVFYTHSGEAGERGGRSRISRFTASESNPNVAEPDSEVVIREDIPNYDYHNGGGLHFGPDGMLYFTVGDTTDSRSAQNTGEITGKMLRMDVNNPDEPPSDNPFAGSDTALGEVWAYGLRNPYTFAIDPETGRIMANDVGEDAWEEINEISPGANYGWPECEGPFVRDSDEPCDDPDYTGPVFAYPHPAENGETADDDQLSGCSVIGGAFYRGDMFPAEYDGSYFFTDYCGDWIARLTPENEVEVFATGTPKWATALNVGPDGALYHLSFLDGAVYRIAYGEGPADATPEADGTPTPAGTPTVTPTPTATAAPGATATGTPNSAADTGSGNGGSLAVWVAIGGVLGIVGVSVPLLSIRRRARGTDARDEDR